MIPQALRALITTLIALAAIFLAIGFVTMIAGCAWNETKEIVTVPMVVQGKQVDVQYEFKDSQRLFLYYEQKKQSEYVTPFMSACEGDITSYPDPNAVESFTEGLIKGLKSF